MNTPICDFVARYAERSPLRLHMPGHKGVGTAMEAIDVTEIPGADSLYEAEGIIAESEANASALFGCPTFYSAEGSSLALRAMLHLACLKAREQGRRPVIAAGRNAHKVFLSAAALLDFEIRWLRGEENYLTHRPTEEDLESVFRDGAVTAVYVTSPDYLGNVADLEALARACHRHGALLLVDNAHGAYLKFLSPSRHPMDLGADLCCDSAHKTLPVLTGGAYLHVTPTEKTLIDQAKSSLALFGSTSPSYLILQSLDRANALCSDGFAETLAVSAEAVGRLKAVLSARGFEQTGDEPLKMTLCPKGYGYTGEELAEVLESRNVICEFFDPDHIVFMFSPTESAAACEALWQILSELPKKPSILTKPPLPRSHEQAITVRQAVLSPAQVLPVTESVGKILASATVGCPPAVPIVACGERITEHDVALFAYYGIRQVRVCRE